MNKKIQEDKENFTINDQGYYVLESSPVFMAMFYFFLVLVFIGVCFSIYLFSIDIDLGVFGLVFSLAIGLISIMFPKAAKENRIEFNDTEIKQYYIFRKNAKVVPWSEIRKIKFSKENLIILGADDSSKILVPYNMAGTDLFLKILSERFDIHRELDKYYKNHNN